MFLEDCYRYNKNKGITEGGKLECKKVIRKDIGEPLAEMYIVDIVASEAAGVSVRFYDGIAYSNICVKLNVEHLQALEQIENNRRITYKEKAIYRYIDNKIMPICIKLYNSLSSKGRNISDPSKLLLLAKLASLESDEQIEGVDICI